MRTSRSRSRSPTIPQFPLILTFPSLSLNNSLILKHELIKKFGVDRLHVTDEILLNEGIYKAVYIYSSSFNAKIESFKHILDLVYPDKSSAEVILAFQSLIEPNTILTLCNKFNAGKAMILPENKAFPERYVKFSGRSLDIEKCVKAVHSFCLDRHQSPEPKPLGLDKHSAKFVVFDEAIGGFLGRNGLFPKRLKADFEVDVKIIKAEGPPCRDNEQVITVSGKHRHIRRSLKHIVKQIIDSLQPAVPYQDQTIKMLILSANVKELIGPQGSVIKDIAKKAGKAKIKVLSDSEIEKSQEYTIVNIDGNAESKQEAACKIYEILSKEDKPSPRLSSPEHEELKIFVSVPDQYVARLIGKNGENVKAIMNKAKCKISFQKAPVSELKFSDGEKSRMCFVSGSSSCISKGVKILLEQIAKLELV